jgi:hypothetical protein
MEEEAKGPQDGAQGADEPTDEAPAEPVADAAAEPEVRAAAEPEPAAEPAAEPEAEPAAEPVVHAAVEDTPRGLEERVRALGTRPVVAGLAVAVAAAAIGAAAGFAAGGSSSSSSGGPSFDFAPAAYTQQNDEAQNDDGAPANGHCPDGGGGAQSGADA